ncbi:carboxypeptidase regulatory-like domain-containing protein [Archangium lansingense]|uniref:Carboxypeptidase regulatory-like domain-containing protein n=1 Tax=Archangium lansingense TaxID=2995310 RepID=A0ABT4AE92_9BACT|nr:carboxypeptidase regulatory-like domain-containing protein [Archangium lansinium]MCY1079970.1 carboxypeptidase regulatory-like domain-containing protein [Archangium lansinium]
MRQTAYNLTMALAFAVVASACGGFDNTPFRTGVIRGRLTEADPSVALVSLVGNPDVRSTVAGDGTFVLEGVPAGPVELFIVASANKAVRLPVMVPGGGSARLQDVMPRAAGFLNLHVRAPARQSVEDGRVSVMGTPFQQLQLQDDGTLRVGPLPEGCYALETSAAGFPVKKTEACVKESESKEVKIQLPGGGDDDCTISDCEQGERCSTEGRCAECTSDEHCAPGLTCRDERCQVPAAP